MQFNWFFESYRTISQYTKQRYSPLITQADEILLGYTCYTL